MDLHVRDVHREAFKRLCVWRLLEYVDSKCFKTWVASASKICGGQC
jgi:hypothetical protein